MNGVTSTSTKQLTLKKRRQKAAGIAVWWMSFLLFFFLNPDRNPLPVCPFHELTGYSCPTCGTTHALHALVHFRLAEALSYHPVAAVIFSLFTFVACLWIVELVSGRELLRRFPPAAAKLLFFIAAAAFLVFWVIRFVAEVNKQKVPEQPGGSEAVFAQYCISTSSEKISK